MLELGSRERQQPAPAHVVWETLVDPFRQTSRPWLDLLTDEMPPRVLDRVRPDLVVWSSLWPDRAEDRVRFDLRAVGQGCSLRWTLTTTGEAPTTSRLGHLRHRLNLLVNDRLRRSFGQ